MSNIQDMKAQLEAIKAEAAQAVAEKIEAAKIQAEINRLTNTKLQDAMVRQQLKEDTTKRLEDLFMQCESIVEGNPVMNAKTKQVRTFNASRRYGLGNQITLVSGLLTGILYSVQEHKDMMLAVTGLTADLVESAVEAFGSLPYYSENYSVVVEGVPADADVLKNTLELVATSLDVELDLSKLTQATLDKQYQVAQVKAEAAMEEAKLTAMTQGFIIK